MDTIIVVKNDVVTSREASQTVSQHRQSKLVGIVFLLASTSPMFMSLSGCGESDGTAGQVSTTQPSGITGQATIAPALTADLKNTVALSEYRILGINSEESITDEKIAETFASDRNVLLKHGDSVLLIQSGAVLPDEALQRELLNHFRITPFSGVVDAETVNPNFSKSLRLAAVKGGCDVIACYWGVFEFSQAEVPIVDATWIPLLDHALFDKNKTIRIRQRLVLVDARTGNWRMITTEPIVEFGDASREPLLERSNRSEKSQITRLKEKAYLALAEQLGQMAAKLEQQAADVRAMER